MPEPIIPVPQDAPKPTGGPPAPQTPPAPTPAPELTPVQQAIVTQAQAPVTGEAMAGALSGAVKAIGGKALDTKLAQIGNTIFETGKEANTFAKEASRQTSAGVLAGVEGAGRATANMLPDRWFEVFGVTDNAGNPVSNFSTDPKDFHFAPNGAWGEFVSEMTTQGIMSLLIAETGGATLGAAVPPLKKAFDFAGNKTRLGQVAAFMNVNGVENLAQRLWETRAEGVQDVRWWAKTLGIESALPEVLASGKDLGVLEQMASDYLGGATGGALAGGTIMGIAKIGLGIIGKGIDSTLDHFGGPPRGTPEREQLALAYANMDHTTRIRDGVEDALNDPLMMQGAPPPREVTGADVLEGGAPVPTTTPIFRVSLVDEATAAAARQRISERLPQTRTAVEEIGELTRRRRAQGGTIVETEEGALLAQQALDLPIAQRRQALVDSVTDRIRQMDDPASGFDPATRQMLYRDVVTVFAYEWTRLLETELPRIVADSVTNKTVANNLLRTLGEFGLPKIASNTTTSDGPLFQAIGVHALIKTFNKIWQATSLQQRQETMLALAKIRAIRFGAERNPTSALSNLIRDASSAAPHGLGSSAMTEAESIVAMTVSSESILQIIRTLHSIAPDGDISRLTVDQRTQIVGGILQNFATMLSLRKAIKTSALSSDNGFDKIVNEAMMRRNQSTPPTPRSLLEGSREAPMRSTKQLATAYNPPPAPPIGTPEYDEYMRTLARSPAQRATLEQATLAGSSGPPAAMPSAATPEFEFAPREILDIQPDTIVMSGDRSVPLADPLAGAGPRPGAYNVGAGFGGTASLLSELASQKDYLAQDMLALIRAGVLDAGETRASLNQIRNNQTPLEPEVVEFMQDLFNTEQTNRLEALVLMTDIFRRPGRSRTINPLDPGFLSDMPTPREIADAARRNAEANISQGRFRTSETDRAGWSPDEVLRRETELDLIAIERELMNMAEGDIRTLDVTSDAKMIEPKSRASRSIDRILGAYSKAHLTFSAGNVAAANTVQYLAEATAAALQAGMRAFDRSPAQLAASYRAKMMWRNIMTFRIRELGALRALEGVARTGRSTVLPTENTAKEMLGKIRTARSQVVLEDPSILDNPNVALEGLGISAPARTLPMADELFRMTIYEAEMKTNFVHRWLETNSSADVEAASRAADRWWNMAQNNAFDRTEAGMLREAAAKVDATGIFRDANNRIKDPITYSAMVMRQYYEDLGISMRMLDDPAKVGTVAGATEGFDIVQAPDFLKKINDDTASYIAHQASATNPEGTAGALAEAISGKDLPMPMRVLFAMSNLFPATRINEAYKMVDYMTAAPGYLLQRMSQRIRRLDASQLASERAANRTSYLYTKKELASPNPVARKRAEARVMFSGLLYAGFLAWYLKNKPSEGEPLTVESATGVQLKEGAPGEIPTVERAAIPVLEERGSKTAARARQIIGQKRGEMFGMEIPILTGASNIFDLVTTGIEKSYDVLSRRATKAIVEIMAEGAANGLDSPEDIMSVLLDVADILGASDFVQTFTDVAKDTPNAFSELLSKTLMLPLGGFSLYGVLADMQSDYKLESRVGTPFGSGTIPVWTGAGSFGENIIRFAGRKGREKRESTTGAKKKQPESLAARVFPKIMAKALGLGADYELDIGDGKSRAANKSLASILASKGYAIPPIRKQLKDPDPIRNMGELDLTRYTMGDNRDAYTHLQDLFMYGDPSIKNVDTGNIPGRIGGGEDNMTLIEFLNLRMAPEDFTKGEAPEIGTSAARPIPARTLDVKTLVAEDYNKILRSALAERMKAAQAALLARSSADKRDGKVPLGIREDWERLATGGVK